jgi:hypothetical protein
MRVTGSITDRQNGTVRTSYRRPTRAVRRVSQRWSSGPAGRLWGAPTANLDVEGRHPEDPLQESFLGCSQRGPTPGASGP